MKKVAHRAVLVFAVFMAWGGILPAIADEAGSVGRMAVLGFFGNRPVVDVYINNGPAFAFILDTGARGMVIDGALAEELDLTENGRAQVTSPAGPGRAVSLYRIDKLNVAGAQFDGINAAAMDMSELFPGGEAPRGMIGPHLFAGYLLTLDFPAGLLSLAEGALAEADGETVLIADFERGPPRIMVDLAGEELQLVVDTGAPSGATLPLSMAGDLTLTRSPRRVGQVQLVDTRVALYRAPLDGILKIGRYSFARPQIRFLETTTGRFRGNIGLRLLGGFRVTMDVANGRMRFENPAED